MILLLITIFHYEFLIFSYIYCNIVIIDHSAAPITININCIYIYNIFKKCIFFGCVYVVKGLTQCAFRKFVGFQKGIE